MFKVVPLGLYPGNVEIMVDCTLSIAIVTTLIKLCSLNSEAFKETMDILNG